MVQVQYIDIYIQHIFGKAQKEFQYMYLQKFFLFRGQLSAKKLY
jgi:hypothetical protein